MSYSDSRSCLSPPVMQLCDLQVRASLPIIKEASDAYWRSGNKAAELRRMKQTMALETPRCANRFNDFPPARCFSMCFRTCRYSLPVSSPPYAVLTQFPV